MLRWKRNPSRALLPRLLLLLGAVCRGEALVTSVAYDAAYLPCSFNFIQGVENLIVVWEKTGKDGKNVQVYKSVNGQNDLSNQDSQFRGRTVFSGDFSQGKLDLTLMGATWNDGGVYYCRAANRINHGDNVVVLSVSAPPLQKIQRAAEDDVTLVPKYFGFPTEINWKVNNNKLVEMELESPKPHFYRLADRAALQNTGSLTIRNLTKGDSGDYKSEAIVNNYIQETEIRLSVLDRVSKPVIINNSTSEHVILLCVSSTTNVSYKWLVNGGETAGQQYTASRPKEDVTLNCTVKNSVSEDSQSITILYKPDYRSHFLPIPIAIVFITAFLFSYKRFWKFKKCKRDADEPTPNIARGSRKDIHRSDITRPDTESVYMRDGYRDEIPTEGFQKTEEEKRDAAELKYMDNVQSPDSDISGQSQEAAGLLGGFQKTEEEKRDAAEQKYMDNVQSPDSDISGQSQEGAELLGER